MAGLQSTICTWSEGYAIERILKNQISLADYNRSLLFGLHGIPPKFSMGDLENEIRRNILNIEDDNRLLHYLYYLIKIFHSLKSETSSTRIYKDSLGKTTKHKYKDEYDLSDIIDSTEYKDVEQLIYYTFHLLNQVTFSSIEFWMILKKEFGFKIADWDEQIVKRKELPSFFDVKKMFNERTEVIEPENSSPIEIPVHKFKWKGTPAQLAYIINLLQDKGWIEGLTAKGERNAKIILTHFDIEGHNSTPESLGKCFQAIKKDELPINPEDAAKFVKFPHRNDLKR